MLTFAFAVFLLIITLGPGVLSLAGVGAAYGWRHGFRYLLGLFLGTNLVCFAVISGLATAVLADPAIRTILLIISVGCLVYLSLSIALADSKIVFIHITKPGVISGLMLQFINPKAYAVYAALFSGFAFYPESLIVETGIKLIIANFIWFLLHCLWLFVGLKINSLELSFRTQRIINLSMALCLLAVVTLSVWSMFS
jgi:threonine/homoserine/homoserine lactone efflux protein